MTLTDTDRAILDLERQRWRYPAAKEERALTELRLTPTRYHAALQRLLNDPVAEAAEPALVRRLRRLRDARRRQRSAVRAEAW